MVSLPFLFLTAMLTVGLGQPPPDTRSGSTPLCVAKEWLGGQAMMTGAIVNGQKHVTHSMTYVVYSAIQRKILARSYKPDYNVKLFDYPAGVLYTLTYPDPAGRGVCTKTPLTVPFREQCIPDNYTVTVDPHTRFGAGVYVTYGWEARGTLGDLTYHVTMSDNMLPMFEEIYGTKDGVPVFQNLFFFNATRAQLTPNDFQVPDSCTQ